MTFKKPDPPSAEAKSIWADIQKKQKQQERTRLQEVREHEVTELHHGIALMEAELLALKIDEQTGFETPGDSERQRALEILKKQDDWTRKMIAKGKHEVIPMIFLKRVDYEQWAKRIIYYDLFSSIPEEEAERVAVHAPSDYEAYVQRICKRDVAKQAMELLNKEWREHSAVLKSGSPSNTADRRKKLKIKGPPFVDPVVPEHLKTLDSFEIEEIDLDSLSSRLPRMAAGRDKAREAYVNEAIASGNVHNVPRSFLRKWAPEYWVEWMLSLNRGSEIPVWMLEKYGPEAKVKLDRKRALREKQWEAERPKLEKLKEFTDDWRQRMAEEQGSTGTGVERPDEGNAPEPEGPTTRPRKGAQRSTTKRASRRDGA